MENEFVVIRKPVADRIPWPGGGDPCSAGPALLLGVLWYNVIFKDNSLYAGFCVQDEWFAISNCYPSGN